jgi:hypothetical protein
VKQETSPDIRNQNASAVDALQEARGMPPGAQRTNALKKAGLLRRVCFMSPLDTPSPEPRSRTLDRALSLVAVFLIAAIIIVARY